MDADTAMVKNLVSRMVIAFLTAHQWRIAPGHGTGRAATAAGTLVQHRVWNTEKLFKVPCQHRQDGTPGTCTIAVTLARTDLGGAVLDLASNVTAHDGPPRGGVMHTSISGVWGGWGTNHPLGLVE